jgi:hypothetical protein
MLDYLQVIHSFTPPLSEQASGPGSCETIPSWQMASYFPPQDYKKLRPSTMREIAEALGVHPYDVLTLPGLGR